MHEAVIITGGAKRLGAEIAMYFAEKNNDIALHYNNSHDKAVNLQSKIRALGVNCELFRHDLRDVSGIPKLMAEIKAKMPNVTTLINNASVFGRGKFLETSEELFDEQFATNFKAPFFLTQEFVKVFASNSGANIINMLDSNITKNGGSHFAYLLSKKTLAEFTKMAARDLGAKVRVNGVCIGGVLPADEADAAYIEKLKNINPLQKNPSALQVAEAVYYLSKNSELTGQFLFIDGGQNLL
jgi:NAD(P)-dependent dehydrogenase (short-subunit alcohol dehydrogenase family)